MTRLLKLTAPLVAVAVLLALTTLTQAEDKTNDDITIDGITLGSHVLGPELKAQDLKGKVVVFEFWGDTCPPCHAAIPGIVKMRGEYSAEKLAIVANQVWTKDAEKAKKAWEKAGGDDTVTVMNHGKLKGASHRGVPHAYIMDHTGKLIWHGNPHPRADGKEMKKIVKEAVEAMPNKA